MGCTCSAPVDPSPSLVDGAQLFRAFLDECCQVATDGTAWVARQELEAAFAAFLRARNAGRPPYDYIIYAWRHMPSFLVARTDIKTYQAPGFYHPYNPTVDTVRIVGIRLRAFPALDA